MKKFTQFDFNHTKKVLNKKALSKKIIKEDLEQKTDVSNFFSKIFESREMAHVYHLQVKGDEGSFAKHEALGKYYEDVVDMIDELVEVYQGQYDIVEDYNTIDTKDTFNKDIEEYFTEVVNFIMDEKKCISDIDTHLHSLIDDIVCLLYKTLYKLKYNK